MSTKKITVIGAGISGLATAYWLTRDGLNPTILEKGAAVGGTMETVFEDGFLFDRGPTSGLETTPLIHTLAEGAGLVHEMIYADEKGNKRYILRNNRLHALPTSLPAFLKSKLFSTRGKLRLFLEPFIGKSEEGYYQSIAEFVRRRLGQEFLDYAINPFVSGVYAGTPESLSVKSAFPKLYLLEENYGGLIKGMILGARERKKRAEKSKQSAKMFSFKRGMESLPTALAEKMSEKLALNATVEKINQNEQNYSIDYLIDGKQRSLDTEIIITTIPAYNLAPILTELDGTLSEHLLSIYYPPVLVLLAGYRKEAVGRPLDGFGFLIPEKERKSFLGAIWSSTIFPERTSDKHAAFTLFIGGARSPELLSKNHDTAIENALREFNEIMKIDEKPVFTSSRFWDKAIPQYSPGYIEHVRYFEQFEKEHPGIFLSGNFRDGISVGDCIANSETTFLKVKEFTQAAG